MEYVNPVSIAGMANGPQGAMLPGTGAGPLDMYLKNQAQQQAYDFLDQAKAAQAQDYVKQQWEMQTGHDKYGLEKQALQDKNAEAQQKLEAGGYNNRMLREKADMLQRQGKMEPISFVGSLHESLQNASPLEAQAILAKAKQAYGQMFPNDASGLRDFDYDGTPEGLQRIKAGVATARQISTFADQSMQQKSGLLGQEYGYKGRMQDKQISSAESMNNADNIMRENVARINAEARRATESGGNAWNNWKADIVGKAQKAKAKQIKGGFLTPEEQADLYAAERFVSGGVTSTEQKMDPDAVRAAEAAKAKGGVEGVLEAVGRKGTVTPSKAPVNEASPPDEIQQIFEKAGKHSEYDPENYEYKIVGDAVVRRKK